MPHVPWTELRDHREFLPIPTAPLPLSNLSPMKWGMNEQLLDHARRYADAYVDANGVALTPIEGIIVMRSAAPTELDYAISRPLVALVLQGRKRVTIGASVFEFGAGESLLVTTDVPTTSQITVASRALPYYSLVMELDPAIIGTLVTQMGSGPPEKDRPVLIDQTEAEIADAALRLLKHLDRPQALAVLGEQLRRELHYWLLNGRHGGGIRALGVTDSHAQRISRAVAHLRRYFMEPVRIETLAKAAGMSLSVFYTHFRSITSITPIQFQKQLRLIEARRLMFADGAAISVAAYSVGYESIPQFTREYGRMFGQPPARDIRQTRLQMAAAE
jgi:AraC-like DNA-binding protein